MRERRNATEFLKRERQHPLGISGIDVLKLSFEDEKSALTKSWDREKQTLLDNCVKEKKDLRAHFERLLREKEEGFKAEKAEMEAKIRKELERIEEVKNELRRTLSQGLGDLENVYFEENAAERTRISRPSIITSNQRLICTLKVY